MILVAGLGNIFLGDDGFGSEVARRANRLCSSNVMVVDFGIRGLDLVYSLMEDHEAIIIVDAISYGGEPGTIYVIEPDFNQPVDGPAGLDPHTMDPMRVLELARSMGAELKNIRIVACEPETFGPDEGYMGLSVRVAAAVEAAVEVVEDLIAEMMDARERPLSEGAAPNL